MNRDALLAHELRSNKYVAKIMRYILILLIAVFTLNLVGVFQVGKQAMLIACILGAVILCIPTLVVDILKQENGMVKYICVDCAAIFVAILYIILSYHTVVMFVFPIAIASIYFQKKMSIQIAITSVITISIAQVIGFYVDIMTDENFNTIEKVITFQVLPRALCIAAIAIAMIGLTKRAQELLSTCVSAEEQERVLKKMLHVKEKTEDVTNHITESMDQLMTYSEKTEKVNQQINEISSQAVAASKGMFQDITEVNENIGTIATKMETMVDKTDYIVNLSKQVANLTSENNQIMSEALKGMNDISASTEKSVEIIHQLEEKSEKIQKIVEVITSISSQTNLLALNAAIEAARAGEQGKGFSVVAEQIRDLAQKTKDSIDEIDQIISEVVSCTNDAVSTMEESANYAKNGVQVIHKAGSSAQEVVSASHTVKEHVDDINQLAVETAEYKQRIVELTSHMKELSARNLSGDEEVALVSTQESEEIKQLAQMIDSLNQLANDLQSVVNS